MKKAKAPKKPLNKSSKVPVNKMTGEKQMAFATGAIRSATVAGEKDGGFPIRYDLLLPTVLKRDAMTLGEGAVKYTDHNYWKGMDEKTLLNHGLAHVFAWMMGDRSEDHLAHARWNFAVIMHLEETRPEFLNLQAAVLETGFYLTPAQRAARKEQRAIAAYHAVKGKAAQKLVSKANRATKKAQKLQDKKIKGTHIAT